MQQTAAETFVLTDLSKASVFNLVEFDGYKLLSLKIDEWYGLFVQPGGALKCKNYLLNLNNNSIIKSSNPSTMWFIMTPTQADVYDRINKSMWNFVLIIALKMIIIETINLVR